MNKTSIEWTHRKETGGATGGFTWNPIRAALKGFQSPEDAKRTIRKGTFCTRISPGCQHCYASTINKRFGNGLEFTVPNLEKIEFFIDEKILEEPLRRKKPATIFVGDMFDLFHEAIPQELIAEVLRIAWKLPRHTFQILTKRAERMHRIITGMYEKWGESPDDEQPRENLWLGVSVESQKYADERIPLLLQTPAAVRFLSVEPMLEKITLESLPVPEHSPFHFSALTSCDDEHFYNVHNAIDWVICGGESGPGARPFNLAWAESLLEQCRAAGVPFFMKQIGSKPFWPCNVADDGIDGTLYPPVKSKGGDPSEWPEHLRVREFPSPAGKLVTA
jgi:protein gp37